MEGYYKKSKGNAGLDGVQFQVGLAAVFLLNALRNLKSWRMSTENKAAGKFDDVVIELSDGSAVLLQAKHKDNRRINKDQLLSINTKNADFSLLKYFFSYQEVKSKFHVKYVIICTNTGIDEKGLEDILAFQKTSPDSLLHLEGEDCSFITFKEIIFSDLRANLEEYYNTSQDKGIEAISDRNLKDFLERLQLFANYPSGDKLEKIVNDKLLSSLTGSELWQGTSYKEIYGKVEAWFKQERGEYLTETGAKAMFFEIKSNQFCKTLKQYDVSFASTNLGLEERKNIFYISVEGGSLLQALKTFHALQEQITLFVNPDDGVEVYMQGAEAFSFPKYKWLVLIFHKKVNLSLICEICGKLKDILDTCSYKKVLLIDNKQNFQQCVLKDGIFEIDGSVKFSNLSETCREKLLRRKNINYQGKRTTLRELLGASLDENYDMALDSEGLEKLVKGEEIRVGTSLGSLDPNIVGYYINRTIEREIDETANGLMSGTRKEEFTEDDIFEVKEKFILISDCAGMGKSTVLAKLAENVKEKYPHLWIIRIELNEYSRILRDSRRRKKRAIKITEFLGSNEATRINNALERFVFSMNKKVVVMLDGFDEISPDYTELVLSLVSQCQEGANFAKVFVTTRPHMNRELGELLRVKPFLLEPFTTKDQIAFLANYWKYHLELDDSNIDKCEKYAKALIDKMSSWVKATYNFTAIPLQVRMLAEIFQENWEQKDTVEWEGCKEFLVGAKREPELPERMRICELYETFIEIKWNISLDKANPTGTASGNISHEFQSDKCFVNHQSFALQEILYKETIHDKGVRHLFSRFQYNKDMEPRMLKIGIVQMANGKLEFVHKTFSEYFVAKSILEISELYRCTFNQDVVFQQFFVDEILCNPQFTVVRAFLESALDDVVDSLPANILEKYRSLAISDPKFQEQQSKLLHLLAREGHVSILKLILKSINFKENVFKDSKDDGNNTLKILQALVEKYGIDIEDELGNTPLHNAIEGSHLDMIRYLVGQGAKIESRNHKGDSVIHLAASNSHLEVMKFLTELGADITADNVGYTALHYAAMGGHLDVCKFLVEGGVDVHLCNKDGISALHAASINGYRDVVKWLIECGHADVNTADHSGTTVLHLAAHAGHFEVCKFLVEIGVDVNVGNEDGITALNVASTEGHRDVVKLLVQCGHADINMADHNGFTALHCAAQEGHLDICKFLVEGGADVNLCNKNDISALYLAFRGGHSNLIKWLVECGHADVNIADHDGFTTLYYAAEEGHLDVCKILGEGGADVNLRNKDGLVALHVASAKGYLDIVKWLVECGHADVNLVNNDGYTALYCAAQEGYLDIYKFLVEGGVDVNLCNNEGTSALHIASLRSHPDVVKWLIECGHADVNIANHDGTTVLHCAAHEGQLDVCKSLVERGVDVNLCDKYGISALHAASLKGHRDVVKLLIQCGHADVNIADNEGLTALYSAALGGHLDICKFLVERGVDVNLCDKDGISALHAASLKGHRDVVKLLVQCGHADVNIADNEGLTALYRAALGGHLDICKFLVERGVDVNVCDRNGTSALHLASVTGNLDLIKWLVECGHADVNITDIEGSAPLHYAALAGHLDVCKFFIEKGIDVNLRILDGSTALHMAIVEDQVDVTKFLVDAGADISIRSGDGLNAFQTADQRGRLPILVFLAKICRDINAGRNS